VLSTIARATVDLARREIRSRAPGGESSPPREAGMFLGGYHYSGASADLLAGYRRLSERIPADSLDLHLCIRTPTGLLVLDACPSVEVFTSFSGGSDFAELNASVGLPPPGVEPLGDVVRALLRVPVDLAAGS
jgi:hypothetical protein